MLSIEIQKTLFLGLGFCLFLHGVARAESAAGFHVKLRPAEAMDQSEIAEFGVVIDGDGILFTSGFSLIVPAVPGTIAVEGPQAGSQTPSSSSSEPPSYREAVP